MALKNSDDHYSRINKIVLHNGSGNLHITLETYKDQYARENTTKFDNRSITGVGLTLSQEVLDAFIQVLYTEIKKQKPYSEMTDV